MVTTCTVPTDGVQEWLWCRGKRSGGSAGASDSEEFSVGGLVEDPEGGADGGDDEDPQQEPEEATHQRGT